ncbi:MAG TPA: S8 family serine peptidase [Actinomycetota bacterium]|nr:S8 family serine peptidase [Actinomycetota bacterium]
MRSRPDFGSPESIAEFVAAARQARARDDFRPARGRLIVKFSSDAAARASARRHDWRVVDTVLGDGSVVLRVPRGISVKAFARRVKDRVRVAYAEPDFRVRALGHTGEAHDWGFDAMNTEAAHVVNGTTGAGVIVAIVDSGVDYLHEDLDDNIWTNPGEIPGNGVDDEGNGFVDDVRGYDFQGNFFTSLDEDNDPMDALGHGTHVAGIVAAEDNGIGVIGVAPDATIMPVKVLDDIGAGWDSQIARGIRYAVDNGADVINMSLGGYFFSSVMRDAVEYAHDNSVTVVAAAGNEFFYSIASFPAGYPSVISVAAAERESLGEAKTWWSNWGNVDFLAPGEEVLSTTPDDTYQRFSGTSMASPEVAGGVALVKEKYGSLGVDASPEQLEQALAVTADARYFDGKDEVSGSGFPDLADATDLPLAGAQVELYRDPHLVASDGSEATITLRMLDGNGNPQVGRTGTFSTTEGTLSSESFLTDGDGEAETILTLEGFFGAATVTADPDDPTAPSRDIRVMVEDDRVRVDDATIAPAFEFEDEFFVEEDASAEVLAEVFNGEPEPPKGEEDPFATLLLDPGDDVVITTFLGNHRFGEPRRASVEFSVTDRNGDPVDQLSGSIEPIDVGFGGRDFLIWISQEQARSLVLTIPEDALPGRYDLSVTVTTETAACKAADTCKTDSYTTPFWVGVRPKVLVVREPFYFNTETFNYFDFSFPSIDWGLKDVLADAKLSFHYANGFPPGPRVMKKFSTVLWLGDWGFLDTFTLRGYLDAGGNALLTGEIWASDDRRFPTTFFRDYLRLSGVLAPFFPDLNNQVYPESVSGLSPGLLDGVTLDVNSYDLNTTGEPTAIFTDELVAQADPEGVSSDQAEYPSGVHAPALAGRHVDDGNFRSLYLGFGIESMDDVGSSLSFGDLLDELVFDVFNPPATITKVVPKQLTTRGGAFMILGTNFQRTGQTIVRVGKRIVTARVISRTEISARLPAGFRPGLYDVKVKNPIGAQVKKEDALRVVRA